MRIRYDAPVRAGTPVPVVVEDRAGVRAVTATVGGEAQALVPPYEVPTRGWSEGTHDLTVRAVNRYGLQAEAHARVQVDNTPPALGRFESVPSRPAPGEEVRLRLVGGERPHEALVRVHGTNDVSRTLPMAWVDGAFEARLTLPPGTYTVSAVASDAAGNTASLERTVEISTRGAPGPAVWILLLAIALSVRPRRR